MSDSCLGRLVLVPPGASQPATDLPDARRIVENPFDSFITGIPGRFDRLVEILTIHEPADLGLLASVGLDFVTASATLLVAGEWANILRNFHCSLIYSLVLSASMRTSSPIIYNFDAIQCVTGVTAVISVHFTLEG